MVDIDLDEADRYVLGRLRSLPHFRRLVFVILFGSRVDGRAHPKSDLDVCCFYDLDEGELADLSVKLASAFPDGYDVSLFQELPLQIRVNVFRGVMVYASDRKRAFDIAYETFNEYRLFRPLYLEVVG